MADAYDVVSQRQTSRIVNGTPQPVVEVTYKAKNIVFTGSVDIPVDSFNASTVDAAITSQLEQHEAVAHL